MSATFEDRKRWFANGTFTRIDAAMNDPINVTLTDGRVLGIVDYTYTPGHPGMRLDPPDSPEVDVHSAVWVTPPECELGSEELWMIHDVPDYDLLLLAVQEREDVKLAAARGDADEETEP
jgi:hypothetical protein